jgi:hypothetical protein
MQNPLIVIKLFDLLLLHIKLREIFVKARKKNYLKRIIQLGKV